jgi:drug/metabolite transporter (DMT)-like permease
VQLREDVLALFANVSMASTLDASTPRRPALASARLKAIGLMCAAVALFACLDSTAKVLVTSGYPIGQVVAARYISNLLILLVFINPWTMPRAFVSARPGKQVFRGMLLLGSTALNFVAVRYLQLAETMSIMFATPFITAILAGVFLGQWLGRARWLAIVLGFVGVLIVLRPGTGGLHWAAFLSLAGACCYAVYGLMTRDLAAHDPPETTVTFGSVMGAALAAPLLFLPGGAVLPATILDGALMIGMGAFGLLGHWCLILAHRHASAQELSPFIYTQMVWMIALGWLLFSDVPNAFTLAGAGVVICSGLYLLTLERRGR